MCKKVLGKVLMVSIVAALLTGCGSKNAEGVTVNASESVSKEAPVEKAAEEETVDESEDSSDEENDSDEEHEVTSEDESAYEVKDEYDDPDVKESLTRYGTIECVDTNAECPFCGIQLDSIHVEYPVFDADEIRNSDIINAKIITEVNKLTAHWCEISPDDPYIGEDSCTHGDGVFDALDTNSYYQEVKKITFLEDRYICIDNSSNSWPGDNPPDISQKVYDTYTGNEITFAEVYTGTEDDLKKIFASEARDDYEECTGKNHFPYEVSSAQEVYDKVYKSVSIDSTFLFEDYYIVYVNQDPTLYNIAYGYRKFRVFNYFVLGRYNISQDDLEEYDDHWIEKTLIYSPYGEVGVARANSLCPHCGEALHRYYEEFFVLDAKYSPYADAINSVMMSDIKQNVGNVTKASADITDEYCGEHSLYLMDSNSADFVEDVKIIDGRYLAVQKSGYDHSIDAPLDRNRSQYLFDLQTGQQLTFKDIYKGSEEDYKQLLCNKLVENFQTYCQKVGITFTEADAKEAYKCAYEKVAFDELWTVHKGIKYYFHAYNFTNCPYEYDGMDDYLIEINVSYQELLGRPTLSE